MKIKSVRIAHVVTEWMDFESLETERITAALIFIACEDDWRECKNVKIYHFE